MAKKAENLLLFLQHVKEQTDNNGGIKKNLEAEAKAFDVKSPNDIFVILRRENIVINTGDKTAAIYKYVSNVEPNLKMAEKILKESREHVKKVKDANKDKKQTPSSPEEPKEPRKPWQDGIDNGTIEPASKFGPGKTTTLPIKKEVCVSDDLFNIIKKIQVMTLLDEKVSSKAINKMINEQLDSKPALKNSYRNFILKSE